VNNLLQISLILFLHWIGDFCLQTRKMAEEKSSSNKWLAIHCGAYTLPLLLIDIKYAILNGFIHMGVDYVSSRMSKKFYFKNKMKEFWIVIGFDQFLHTVSLIGTYELFKMLGLL